MTDEYRDKFYAAMETGNHVKAREVMQDVRQRFGEDYYIELKLEGISEYGIDLG